MPSAGSDPAQNGDRAKQRNALPSAAELQAYRQAVANVVSAVSDDPAHTELVLGRRVDALEFAAVLTRTPYGLDRTIEALLAEIRRFRPNPASSARDLPALVRVQLLSQIDVAWWGTAPLFESDADLHRSSDLVDLQALRTAQRLRFNYRVQARTVRLRAARAFLRRVASDRRPGTIGLRLTMARPETVALLNQCADEFVKNSPVGTPPLWVNSLARSVEYQAEMRSLGYAAVTPSAHCSGWAVDVEMEWFRRLGVARYLQDTLLGRLADGDVNVIDEGPAWHMCVSPAAVASLRRSYDEDLADG
jgi:hypothetical protein